uniref:BURP domain-containing protein n=1 Tax=Oryza brachyantha TaxID=4533 RepID=J3LW38_ORYBR
MATLTRLPLDYLRVHLTIRVPTPTSSQLPRSSSSSKTPSMALFFLEKNLQQGKKISLHFTNTMASSTAMFLPRSEAKSIPFSSNDMPVILARLGVGRGSGDAAVMSRTLHYCELPSLESMVDFVTSTSGFETRDVNAESTVLVSKARSPPAQEYTVAGVKPMGGTGQLIACHPRTYVYAVFLCHRTEATRAYTASLVSEDGTAARAVAVCHTDTAGWNPEHAAFQILGVKPGTVPVCHFVKPDAVVWTRTG